MFGFVKQSGGHVKIYSELGQGTTVKIYLPRYYGGEDERAATETRLPATELKGMESILLVEDDANVLALTSAGLRDLGYTVLEARHANDAMAHLVNGARRRPDADRYRHARHQRTQACGAGGAIRPGLRVLFMTGFTKNAVVHNGVLDAGVHFLAKPFTLDELARKLREVLESEV